jgi:hypothetical protein
MSLGFDFRFICLVIHWSGNIFGGLAQGRKPHGGSERPYCRPPLTFIGRSGPLCFLIAFVDMYSPRPLHRFPPSPVGGCRVRMDCVVRSRGSSVV